MNTGKKIKDRLCPIDSGRVKKYLKNAGLWVVVFYCVKGTLVTAGAVLALIML